MLSHRHFVRVLQAKFSLRPSNGASVYQEHRPCASSVPSNGSPGKCVVAVTSETFPRLSLCVWDVNHQNKCGCALEPGLWKKKVDEDKQPLLTFSHLLLLWCSLSKPLLQSRAVGRVMLLCLWVGLIRQFKEPPKGAFGPPRSGTSAMQIHQSYSSSHTLALAFYPSRSLWFWY